MIIVDDDDVVMMEGWVYWGCLVGGGCGWGGIGVVILVLFGVGMLVLVGFC